MVERAEIEDYARRIGVPESAVRRIAFEEAFLRRAAAVDGPFVLKGSYVTRQYLEEGWRRIPGDLDWVGLGPLDSAVATRWVTAITETGFDDGIRFRSFAENAFWRGIDYAMHDDFPTVNTDLLGWLGPEKQQIAEMDVSFGLDLRPPPVPLTYLPLFGDPFIIRRSCALELQVAWKLHQCLVRPRFKDLLDLILILRENRLQVDATWQALEAECRRDATPFSRFDWLLNGKIGQHPSWTTTYPLGQSFEARFRAWRDPAPTGGAYWEDGPLASVYLEPGDLPHAPEDFLSLVASSLKSAGFVPVSADAGHPDRPWWRPRFLS